MNAMYHYTGELCRGSIDVEDCSTNCGHRNTVGSTSFDHWNHDVGMLPHTRVTNLSGSPYSVAARTWAKPAAGQQSSLPKVGSSPFEPTPIGPKASIHVVTNSNVFEDGSFQSLSKIRSLYECMRPLLIIPSRDDDNDAESGLVEEDQIVSCVKDKSSTMEDSDDTNQVRLRPSHLEQWEQRYKELLQFRKANGHCLVPLEYADNRRLAHWVKRQRAQWKLRRDGKHSTLTEERQKMLEKMDFIWDSHRAAWEEKFRDLQTFKQTYGHCNVPTLYPKNPQLASWLKCQRRQLRAYHNGTQGADETKNTAFKVGHECASSSTSSGDDKLNMRSTLSADRVNRLIKIGIRWEKRRRARKLRQGS